MSAARGRLIAGWLLIAAAAGGCGNDAGNGGGITAVRAGAATTATGSFRVSTASRTFDPESPKRTLSRSTGKGFVDVAHDRSRFTSTGDTLSVDDEGDEANEFEVITIGSDIWIRTGQVSQDSEPAEHFGIEVKPWIHDVVTGPSGGAFAGPNPVDLLGVLEKEGAELRSLGHETVRNERTEHFAVDLPEPVTTRPGALQLQEGGFKVWVDDASLVRRMLLVTVLPAGADESTPDAAQANEMKLEFFDFGAQEDVKAPPADQVSEAGDSAPCDMTGSPPETAEDLTVCTPESVESPDPPDLPSPKITGRSALQFRPVRSLVPGACPPSGGEPAVAEPVRLPGQEDNCYDLGPSGLRVTHADVHARTDFGGTLVLDFTLDDADAAAFDNVAAANVGKQVAIVIFGRVISAPTIQQADFNGRGQISGIDPQTAADIIAAVG